VRNNLMAAKPTVHDEPSQIDRFKALAHEPGCDGDDAASEEALKKVAESPHQPKHEPRTHKAKG
jgi:hypothetical protein